MGYVLKTSKLKSSSNSNILIDDAKKMEEIKRNQRLLYTIPNCPVTRTSVVDYIHNWAVEQTVTGTSIQANKNENGVFFTFKPSPNSYLNVFIDSINQNDYFDVLIYSSFGLYEVEGDLKKNSHSLIKFVAQNLIDSLVNDIGALIMNTPENPVQRGDTLDFLEIEKNKEELLLKEMEREEKEYNDSEEIYQEELLRAQVHAEQQKEEEQKQQEDIMSNLLTSKEAMKLWKSEKLSEEESRQFDAELKSEREKAEMNTSDNDDTNGSNDSNIQESDVKTELGQGGKNKEGKGFKVDKIVNYDRDILEYKDESKVYLDKKGNEEVEVYSWTNVDTDKSIIMSYIQGEIFYMYVCVYYHV